MDTSQSEKVSNASLAVEQNNETIEEPIQETEISKASAKAEYEDLNSVKCGQGEIGNEGNSLISSSIEILSAVIQREPGNNENSDKDSKDLTEKENFKTVQKEAIEILNVELVAPGRSQVNLDSESVSLVSSEIDVVEFDQKQVENEIALEETNMETIEVNAAPTTDEVQQLPNCSESFEKYSEPAKISGLSLLAQYDSDDADSVVEVPLSAGQDYRNQVFEIESDDSSSSSDDSSSSDVEYLNELRKTIEKRIEIADEDDAEDDDQEDCTGKRRQKQKLRVKGELLLEDLPPIQDLQITVPANDCVEFGKIHSIVDQLVLVSALPSSILLDLDTVIFFEKGQRVLGEVFDVLGQVADPLYCVRFNSNKQIKEKQIKVGDVVYVAPKTQYTQYVILSNLMTTKGSDASWENDMEPPPKFLDYSDDEQEILARKQLRNKDRPIDSEDAGKRPRTVHNNDSMSSSCYQPNTQNRSRYEQRNNRGSPAGHSNIRPRYNSSHQFQQRAPNHHRSSWHSNYNPQNFATQPPSHFRMHVPQNQPQSPHSNMLAYGMPNAHNLSYAPPPPYGVPPPMLHQNSQQIMPNAFSIRPPNLHGPPPHAPYHHQYISNPPPPPGSQ